ncbi:MAG: hypothetical protein AABY22_21220 [Nanoarchaeota archaeon]
MKKEIKTMQEVAIEEQNQQVLIYQLKDRPDCFTANGSLICYCGKCQPQDHEVPKDF